MPVLTPAEAAKILDRMRHTPADTCELCGTVLNSEALETLMQIGPYPVWMCTTCRQRHEKLAQRRRETD